MRLFLYIIFFVLCLHSIAYSQEKKSVIENPYSEIFSSESEKLAQICGSIKSLPHFLKIYNIRDWISRHILIDFFNNMLSRRNCHPLIEAQIRYGLSQQLFSTGHEEIAKDEISQLGLVQNWMILGAFPFSQSESNELPAVFSGICGKNAEFDGLPGMIAWRQINVQLNSGMVPIDSLLFPQGDVTSYAFTALLFPSSMNAVLRIGGTGKIAIWINGRFAGRENLAGDPHIDQVAFSASFKKGKNSILIEAGNQKKQQGFFFRVTDKKGNALKAIRVSPDSCPENKSAALPSRTDDPFLLYANLAKNIQKPEDLLNLALVFSASGRKILGKFSSDSIMETVNRMDETFLDKLPELAEYIEEDHKKANFLHKILDKNPSNPAALYELAQYYYNRRQIMPLMELINGLRNGMLKTGKILPVELLYSKILIENQMIARSLEIAEELEKSFPDIVNVLKLRTLIEQQRGFSNEIFHAFSKLLPYESNSIDVHFFLFEVLKNKRDFDQAIRHLYRLIEIRPDIPAMYITAAQYLENLDRTEEAKIIFEKGLSMIPDNPDLLEAAGKFYHRTGLIEKSLFLLNRSLAVRPQNPDLKDYVTHLAPEQKTDDGEWNINIDQLAGSYGPDSKSKYLLDKRIITIFKNGLSSSHYLKVIAVSEKMSSRTIFVRYDPANQKAEVIQSYVWNNSVRRDVLERNDISLSESWYGIYYDYRAVEISFTGLNKGDIIVLEYSLNDTGKNIFGDNYSELHMFQDDIPVSKSLLKVVYPENRILNYDLHPASDNIKPCIEEKTKDGSKTLEFAFALLPEIPDEKYSTGYVERSTYVHISTFRDFRHVVSLYGSLLKDQMDSNQQIREKVASLTDGISDGHEKIKALYEFVAGEIRYVGLEFGMHSYKPYNVQQIFERKFGDCKDKSLLLSVMLGEAGIESNLALVRTRNQGMMNDKTASLSIFDHAVLYIPAYKLWLDPTAKYHGIYEFPAMDQEVNALIISDETKGLTLTPSLPYTFNSRMNKNIISMKEDGSGEVQCIMEFSGLFNEYFRRYFEVKEKESEKVESKANQIFQGIKIKEFLVQNAGTIRLPGKMSFSGTVPSVANRTQSGLNLALFRKEENPFFKYISMQQERKNDVVLDFPFQITEEADIIIPEHFRPASLPPSQSIVTKTGFLEFIISMEGQKLHYFFRYAVTAGKIPAQDFIILKKFILNIERIYGEEIHLIKL